MSLGRTQPSGIPITAATVPRTQPTWRPLPTHYSWMNKNIPSAYPPSIPKIKPEHNTKKMYETMAIVHSAMKATTALQLTTCCRTRSG
ncbi:MAG: hypothetical protein VB817_07260 [Pirellulaceae bacterium]